MFKKSAIIMLACLGLAACASSSPRVIQATSGMPDIHLTVGMATQIEMPEEGRVQSITVGDPSLVSAEQNADVVNLVAKGGAGETNLIIRSRDSDDRIKVYQYHIYVQMRCACASTSYRMPELPEVETVCRGLAAVLTGARIAYVEQKRQDLRRPFPPRLDERLKGRQIIAVSRRAKYILLTLDKGEVLLLHLGMSGRLLLEFGGESTVRKHDHLILHFTDQLGLRLTFNDPRRFGLCALIAKAEMPRHPLLRSLGPEPLEPSLTPARLGKILAGRKTSLKAALLDQKLIAGLGNIYVCEALFHAGIDPRRSAGSCTLTELKKLLPAIRRVLRAAIKAGGSSLRDYVQTDGGLGFFQNHFAVYGRDGQNCSRCRRALIHRLVQGGRSTFFCAHCQR
jgi:formamidopyrimidine-DNA glycosylase